MSCAEDHTDCTLEMDWQGSLAKAVYWATEKGTLHGRADLGLGRGAQPQRVDCYAG